MCERPAVLRRLNSNPVAVRHSTVSRLSVKEFSLAEYSFKSHSRIKANTHTHCPEQLTFAASAGKKKNTFFINSWLPSPFRSALFCSTLLSFLFFGCNKNNKIKNKIIILTVTAKHASANVNVITSSLAGKTINQLIDRSIKRMLNKHCLLDWNSIGMQLTNALSSINWPI